MVHSHLEDYCSFGFVTVNQRRLRLAKGTLLTYKHKVNWQMVTKKGNRTEKWMLKMRSVQFRLANAQNLLQTVPGLQDRCVVREVFEGVPNTTSRDVLRARWTDTRQDRKAGQVDVAATADALARPSMWTCVQRWLQACADMGFPGRGPTGTGRVWQPSRRQQEANEVAAAAAAGVVAPTARGATSTPVRRRRRRASVEQPSTPEVGESGLVAVSSDDNDDDGNDDVHQLLAGEERRERQCRQRVREERAVRQSRQRVQ